VKPARSLRSRALQLLSQREQSKVELRRKLLRHAEACQASTLRDEREARTPGTPASTATGGRDAGAAPTATAAEEGSGVADRRSAQDEVDEVIDWLEAHAFLSADRFVESRVHARENRFGNVRIRHELAQHGVSLSPDVERSLAESELARARAVHERKFAGAPRGPAEMARQARFLAARGFSGDVIRQVIREAHRSRPDDA
jgi:regulatory protein